MSPCSLCGLGVYSVFIPLTNLVFKWTSYEDGFFFTYVGLCSFGAYLGLFPFLQFLYKRFVIRTSRSKAHGYTRVEQLESELEDFNLEERGPAPAVIEGSSDTDTISTLKMDASFFLGGTILFGISFIIVPLFMSVPTIFIGKWSGQHHASRLFGVAKKAKRSRCINLDLYFFSRGAWADCYHLHVGVDFNDNNHRAFIPEREGIGCRECQ